jgi:hypothetical protein
MCYLKFEKAAAVQYPGEEGAQRGSVHCLQARNVPNPIAGVQRRLRDIQLSRQKEDDNPLKAKNTKFLQKLHVYDIPYRT